MQKIAELLKTRNVKVTPQRIAIYNALYKTKEHPTAEIIYKSIQQSHPTMSLATVYKTLDAFKGAGLVQELNTGTSFRYDADTSSHPHVVCIECGDVHDLHTHHIEKLRELVQSETNFELIDCKVYFSGICPKCKN